MNSRSAKQRKKRQRRLHRRARFEALERRELLTASQVDFEGYIDDTLLVQFNETLSADERASILSTAGATEQEYYNALNVVLVSVDGNEADRAAQLESLPEVENATRNQERVNRLVPNDPLFPEMWNLNNTGQSPVGGSPIPGTPDADVDAPEAWNMFVGSSDVVVAVIDSGADLTHPDLAPNLWVNPFEIPGDGLDNDGNGYVDDLHGINADTNGPPQDIDVVAGHGTHVSGTIAAVGNNNEGTTGVSWNTKVMPLAAIGTPGGTADVVEVINYMINMKNAGVNIVASNNSWGAPMNPAPFNPIEFFAIERSIQEGILFVAAAGNVANNNDVFADTPSGYRPSPDGLISVAWSDKFDDLSPFSNFGPTTVDLAAPGDEIISLRPVGIGPDPIFPMPLGYQVLSGTSMSTPHVAGTAALLAGLNSSLTPVQLKQIIMDTVDVIPGMDGTSVTGGRLNTFRALQEVPAGEIRGTVYEDINANGVQDFNEPGLGGWVVYTDLNNNGRLDLREPRTTSRTNGTYTLPHYRGAGSFTISQIIEPGFIAINPASGSQTVNFSNFNQTIEGVNFGNQQVQVTVSGTKWHDHDGDGQRDDGDDPLAGFYIYVDLNQNGRPDFGEPSDTTDQNGNYRIFVPGGGSYVVREASAPGWTQTFPANDEGHSVFIDTGVSLSNLDFGNSGQMHSFGTAPKPFPAGKHGYLPGFQMGASLIAEPSRAAATDADADGVSISGPLFAGATATMTVDVQLGGQPRGYLQGWMDFDHSMSFDPDERVVHNARLGEGTHTLSFTVPNNAQTGTTWARFRYGWERDWGPGGKALAGEVEDYAVDIFGDDPVAVADSFDGPNAVDQDSDNNVLNVLANDLPSSSPPLRVVDVQMTSDEDGEVMIQPGGGAVLYTPRPGFFGTDAFTYTLEDAAGTPSTATVTVVVLPSFNGPIAVDDIVSTPLNTSRFIQVLENDLDGPFPPKALSQIVTPPASGVAVIDNSGTVLDPSDDVIVYQPNTGFQGTDQLVYEIQDSLGQVSEATVTVQVGNTAADDKVAYTFNFTDLGGSDINSVDEGETFYVEVYTADVRPNPVPPPPADDRRGVFAGYLDVLYDRDHLVVAGPVEFAGAYDQATEGNTFVPGTIDEAGAFRDLSLDPPGGNAPLLLFRVPMRAINADPDFDITTNVVGDPANLIGVDFPDESMDVSGVHDTLLYVETVTSGDVEISEIFYDNRSITINADGGGGEGEFHNLVTRSDVNNDRMVSSMDLALIVSDQVLNGSGSDLYASGEAEGEFSSASVRSSLMVDTNNDGLRTPEDILIVLNDLLSRTQRRPAGAEGEAEGEGEGEGEPLTSMAIVTPRAADDQSSADAAAVVQQDQPVDSSNQAASIDLLLASAQDQQYQHDRQARDRLERLMVDLEPDFFLDIGGRWEL